MSSVEPKQGSTTGGTGVTILGSGFGEVASDVIVSFGGSLCDVILANISQIVCRTGANAVGNKNLNVSCPFLLSTRI